MSAVHYGPRSLRPTPGVSGADGLLMTGFRALRAEWRARKALRAVEALSDGMLHDIGLTRGEIHQAVRHGRGGGSVR